MSQQSEVKEYFIDTDSYANPSDSMIGFESMTADMIHVILKSEYDKLKEELQKDLDLAMQIMNELGKENQNLKTLLGECELALDQALRQWDMYASNSQENLEESDDMEAIVYRDGVAILQKIKDARVWNV